MIPVLYATYQVVLILTCTGLIVYMIMCCCHMVADIENV
jgi:hypothetical protein